MDMLLSLLIGMLQRKLRFVAILGTVFIGVILYVQGFTTQNIIFTVIFVVIVGLFAILVSFWTAIFRSLMSKRR